ncbi:MAG: hypothetical protein GY749_14560 [Desulfobacteraceae bacterium]|nr:hypothetical protein [Desulfobacteraceae bacterium]
MGIYRSICLNNECPKSDSSLSIRSSVSSYMVHLLIDPITGKAISKIVIFFLARVLRNSIG